MPRTTRIVGNDDVEWVTATNGKLIPVIWGTPGDDHLVYTGTLSARVLIIGGKGADWVEKVPGAGPMLAYEDNAAPIIPSVGPRFTGGNGRIDFGPGDIAKSGAGKDVYRGHGTGEHFARDGAAQLFIDLSEDVLVMPADGYRVTKIGVQNVTRTEDGFRAQLSRVGLEFENAGPFDGQRVLLMIGGDRGGMEERPDFYVEYEPGGRLEAVEDFIALGHDGRGHDWLEF